MEPCEHYLVFWLVSLQSKSESNRATEHNDEFSLTTQPQGGVALISRGWIYGWSDIFDSSEVAEIICVCMGDRIFQDKDGPLFVVHAYAHDTLLSPKIVYGWIDIYEDRSFRPSVLILTKTPNLFME